MSVAASYILKSYLRFERKVPLLRMGVLRIDQASRRILRWKRELILFITNIVPQNRGLVIPLAGMAIDAAGALVETNPWIIARILASRVTRINLNPHHSWCHLLVPAKNHFRAGPGSTYNTPVNVPEHAT